MIATLLKLFAYTQAPKRTFAFLHPKKAAKTAVVPWDIEHGYAPRLAVLMTAALVAPLAYRLGRRAGERTLLTPNGTQAGSNRRPESGMGPADGHPYP